MAGAVASGVPQVMPKEEPTGLLTPSEEDPFAHGSTTPEQRRNGPYRFSAFDTQLFAHYQPLASPSQAKRALEAHLSETDRRLEEASKLGTALVQQRKDLADRLKEVEARQGEGDIGPELRQKLIEVEREYNELGRDSARAFLAPRTKATASEESTNGFSAMDARVRKQTPLPQIPAD
jgi:chromosome segregation ATPase